MKKKFKFILESGAFLNKQFCENCWACNFFSIWLRMLISFLNDVDDIQLILDFKNCFGKYHSMFFFGHHLLHNINYWANLTLTISQNVLWFWFRPLLCMLWKEYTYISCIDCENLLWCLSCEFCSRNGSIISSLQNINVFTFWTFKRHCNWFLKSSHWKLFFNNKLPIDFLI